MHLYFWLSVPAAVGQQIPLIFSELWHNKCLRAVTDIKTDQQDHNWKEKEAEDQNKSSKCFMYGML